MAEPFARRAAWAASQSNILAAATGSCGAGYDGWRGGETAPI
jgi:hypothetical protein